MTRHLYAHAPECHGPIYGCAVCGKRGLTIETVFAHKSTCPGRPKVGLYVRKTEGAST